MREARADDRQLRARDGKAQDTEAQALAAEIEAGALPADALIERYCALLYARSKSYVEVARITGLDRRLTAAPSGRLGGAGLSG